jgi:hypothetical protein
MDLEFGIREPEKTYSGSRISDPGSRIPDPGVKKASDPGSWIRIRNTGQEVTKLCPDPDLNLQ